MPRQGPTGEMMRAGKAGAGETAKPASRWALPAQAGDAEALCWNDAAPGELTDLIDAITRTGAAVSFSKLRAANGVSITILDGPERDKHYARNQDELNALIRRLRSVA